MNDLASRINFLARNSSGQSTVVQERDTRSSNEGDSTTAIAIMVATIAPWLLATFFSLTTSYDIVTIDQNRRQLQHLRQTIGRRVTTTELPLEDITGSDREGNSFTPFTNQLLIWIRKGDRPRGQYKVIADGIGITQAHALVKQIDSYLISPIKTYRDYRWIAEQSPDQLTIFQIPYGNLYADDNRLIYKVDRTTDYFIDRSDVLERKGQEKRYKLSTIKGIERQSKPDLKDTDYELVRHCLVLTEGQRQPIFSFVRSNLISGDDSAAEWLATFLNVPLKEVKAD